MAEIQKDIAEIHKIQNREIQNVCKRCNGLMVQEFYVGEIKLTLMKCINCGHEEAFTETEPMRMKRQVIIRRKMRDQ